jgi:hypothetical protein
METDEREMSMTSPVKPGGMAAVLACALAVAGLAFPAFAQEQTTTDIGTLDKATAAKVFPAKPPYSPYAGRNFPTRVGRPAPDREAAWRLRGVCVDD